jgi:hypothetical protein
MNKIDTYLIYFVFQALVGRDQNHNKYVFHIFFFFGRKLCSYKKISGSNYFIYFVFQVLVAKEPKPK